MIIISRVAKEAAEGTIEQDDPKIEELMLSMKALMEEPMIVIREGLVFDFPECDSVIVDPMCRQLRGFVGANWIAHEMFLTPEEVEEIYQIDLGEKFKSYDVQGRLIDMTDPYSKTTSFFLSKTR